MEHFLLTVHFLLISTFGQLFYPDNKESGQYEVEYNGQDRDHQRRASQVISQGDKIIPAPTSPRVNIPTESANRSLNKRSW